MDYYATQAVLSGVFDLVAALGVATLTTAYLADTLHPKSKERVAAWKKRKRARGEALWMPELTSVAVPAPAEEAVGIAPEPVVEVEPEPIAEPIAELTPEPVAEVVPEPVVEAEPEPEPLAPPQELAIPTAVEEPQVLEQMLEPALQPLPAALQQAELERVEVSQEVTKAAAQVEQNLDDSQ